MQGAAGRGLLNANSDWVPDVLEAVKDLRQAYRGASADDMEQRVRELRSLLDNEGNRAALDIELKTRRILMASLDNRDLIERETALGGYFGYTRREVKSYVRRARGGLTANGRELDIADTQQLAEHLERLHTTVARAMAGDGGWWKRRRDVRRACSWAQDGLFAIGVLVADAARRPLFDLSYSLAVMTLREDET